MTPAGRAALQELIAETWRWLGYHKARKAAGRVEALACHIRLQALRDAQRVLDDLEKITGDEVDC